MIIIPILSISYSHFSLKGWENVVFELAGERILKCKCTMKGAEL